MAYFAKIPLYGDFHKFISEIFDYEIYNNCDDINNPDVNIDAKGYIESFETTEDVARWFDNLYKIYKIEKKNNYLIIYCREPMPNTFCKDLAKIRNKKYSHPI
jgi:hypothetical protein